MHSDGSKGRSRTVQILRPVRASALLAGIARAWLGALWSESEFAQAANVELVDSIDALRGYFCKAGRN